MSWVRLAQQMSEATGKCTRCGALAKDEFAACPLDGYCPAPDYHERRMNRLFDERRCAAWKEDGKPCMGVLDRFHTCLACGHGVYKRNGVYRIEVPPLVQDDYIPDAERRAAEFRRLGLG